MLGSPQIDLGNPVADHGLNYGLTAWWLPLPNNQGGSRLFDLCGKSPGTLTNGPTWTTGPRPEFAAVQYDGTNDYASLGTFTGLGSTNRTLAVLFRPTTVDGTSRRVVCFPAGEGADATAEQTPFVVNVRSTGAQVGFGGTPYQGYINYTPTANAWHFLVASVTGQVCTAWLWKDGAYTSLGSSGTNTGGVATNPVGYIGRFNTGYGQYFAGQVADVRLYYRPSDAGFAAALYDQSRRGHPDTLRRWSPRARLFGGSGSSAVSVVLGALSGVSSPVTPVVAVNVPVTLGALTTSGTSVAPVAAITTIVAPGATASNITIVSPSVLVGSTVTPGVQTTRGLLVSPTVTVGNTIQVGPVASRGVLVSPTTTVGIAITLGVVATSVVTPSTTLTTGNLVVPSPLSGAGVIPSQSVSNGTGLTLGAASVAGTVVSPSLTANTLIQAGAVATRAVLTSSTITVGNAVASGVVIGSAVAVNPNVAVALNVATPTVTTRGTVVSPNVFVATDISLTPTTINGTFVSPSVLWGVTLLLQPLTTTGDILAPDLNVDLIAFLGSLVSEGSLPTVTVLIISDLTVPGGVFRRAVLTWGRVTERAVLTWGRVTNRPLETLNRATERNPSTWDRIISRTVETWTRVWRYSEMSVATEGKEIVAAVGDDRDYGFDARFAPELKSGSGITITSAVITGGTGLTIGTPVIIDAVFDGIPVGKGVRVQISGGTAGTKYRLACVITLSNGREIVIPATISKVPDYDGAP